MYDSNTAVTVKGVYWLVFFYLTALIGNISIPILLKMFDEMKLIKIIKKNSPLLPMRRSKGGDFGGSKPFPLKIQISHN